MDSRPARWVDERVGLSSFSERAFDKVFPDHWSFMLGEVALYSFIVLVATGIFLTFFYVASPAPVIYGGPYAPLRGLEVSSAFDSVMRLSFSIRAGLVMRQMHHWAAIVFVGAIVAHLCRIFFTGAFRRPREPNWMIGVTLLMLGMLNGFTGYSLPDDLLSGTGLRIAYSVALSIPLAGPWVAFLLFGGEFPSTHILGRLLVIHILIVPALIVGLISIHLALLWRQKHTQFPGPGRREDNVVGSRLWPVYAMKSAGLFLLTAAVLAALGGLVQINPIWQYGPFDPTRVTSPAQPDWYLGWMEGALRMFPPVEPHLFGWVLPNPFFPAILLPGITFGLLYLWPFLEQRVSGDRSAHHLLDRPRDRPVRTALGLAAISFYGVLFVGASNDLIARWLHARVEVVTDVFRFLLFLVPILVGLAAHRTCRALAHSDVERLTRLPIAAFRSPKSGGRSG